MKLFQTEGAARRYVERKVPPAPPERKPDLTPLREPLFETAETPEEGEYTFEGPNGLRISYRLVNSRGSFHDVHQVYGGSYDEEGRKAITGEFHPIFSIYDLRIETPHFTYGRENQSRHTTFTWAPNLRSTSSELSHSGVYIERGEIYLIGDAGFLSRPLDLLSLFHELGHVETRTPDQMVEERRTVRRIDKDGYHTEPWKEDAYDLQRERDANAWMLKTALPLFEDIGVTREQVGEYIHLAQLESYHENSRYHMTQDPVVEE